MSRSAMGESVAVRPDQVSLRVLVSAVPWDAVDAAVAACGVSDRRSGGKLPAHVIAYLTMALCLFTDDDYEEVATNDHYRREFRRLLTTDAARAMPEP
jgi:Insertion element 4 transposase N-terminal